MPGRMLRAERLEQGCDEALAAVMGRTDRSRSAEQRQRSGRSLGLHERRAYLAGRRFPERESPRGAVSRFRTDSGIKSQKKGGPHSKLYPL